MFQVQPWINRSTEVPNLSDIVNAVSKGEESRLQSTKHTEPKQTVCQGWQNEEEEVCRGKRNVSEERPADGR